LHSTVDILPATPEDADTLTRIAFAAKRYWGYPESWIQHWRDSLTITPAFVRNSRVYAAVSCGEPCAFYALTGAGGELELEHLWVLPGWIVSGVGRLLFEHAMRQAARRGANAVAIEADPNAEGFYLRMGARRVGEIVYEIESRERKLPLLTVELSKPVEG
jgi:GNAT superfamily N-acetyltransferase